MQLATSLPQPLVGSGGWWARRAAAVRLLSLGGPPCYIDFAIPLSSHDASCFRGGGRKAGVRDTAGVPTNNPFEQEGTAVAPLLLCLEELEASARAGQEHPEALCGEGRPA